MTSNPFATRFLAPGRIPWQSPEYSVAQMVGKFKRLAQRASIVGPHGSGKSTLLESMVPELGQIVYRWQPGVRPGDEVPQASSSPGVIWLQLRADLRPFSRILATRNLWGRGGLLVLDGFEQLPWYAQYAVRLGTKLSNMRLLVTSHRPVGLAVLLKTAVTLDTAHKLAEDLIDPQTLPASASLISRSRLEQLLIENDWNLREVWMNLYDDYESFIQKQNASRAAMATPPISNN